MNNQKITLYIDDSGKLNNNEKIATYGGLVFTDDNSKLKFNNIYKKAVWNIKCKYCKKDFNNCDRKCPEIKHSKIDHKHVRMLINILKKYDLTACIISNENVYPQLKTEKGARGRFLDYCIKIMVKNVVVNLIKEKRINPKLPLTIELNMDEQTTKSNGYYSLDETIREELETGFRNFNYGLFGKPVINNKVTVKLSYHHSNTNYYIQGADIIAGFVRKVCLFN